ncbi:nibrin-like [Phymastichus coffea]|uniref:nibrin-like n=1 Tax=Phymastichus coffea TaxID=108790 RepID=UPI00273B07A1|nr:nibrin-like [Phymastichus coffea]XP_058799142.1 nibrin-like [Phymastichus coffea]
MWMLKDAKGNIKYLKPNKTVKVGRKDADIILENDSSISRAHALITVTLKEQVQTSEESSTCLIKDSNSKYGSFIVRNGSKLKVTKEGLELHHGDTLTFGLQNCIYSVEYIHFVTVISRLNAGHKQKLKSIMDDIGGLIIDFYNSHCTHLTATTAATTTKIIFALINGVPIIGIDYWIQLKKCIEENTILPDPSLFVLSLQDTGVNIRKVSLKPNPLRKTLFQNKIFIFFTEQSCNEYREMIQQAGGSVKVYAKSSSIPDIFFSNNYIIMKVPINDSSTEELVAFDTLLQNKMKEKNVRTVNETEIPLAIIYASLDQYCNPEYDFIKLLKRRSHVEDTSEVLALDTQEITSVVNQNTKYKVSKISLIPETNDIQNDSQSQDLLNQDFQVSNSSSQAGTHIRMTNEKSIENSDDCSRISIPGKNTIKNDFVSYAKISNKNLKASDSIRKKETSILSNNEQDLQCNEKKTNNSKKQHGTSDVDEIDENIKQFWPSKKRGSMFKTKAVPEDTKHVNIFKEPKSQITEENNSNKSKIDKWGFKKSNKKSRDFDLDDIDKAGSMDNVKKRKIDIFDSPTKEIPKSFDLYNLDEDKPKKIIKNIDNDILCNSNSVFAKNESEKRNKKAKTILESETDFKFKQIQLEVKPIETKHKRSYTKSNKNVIPEDEINEGISTSSKPPLVINIKRDVDVDSHASCGKIFKKKYNQIPVVRVPLAEMTVWRSH